MNKMNDKLKQFYKDTQRAGSINLSEDAKHRVKDNVFSKLGTQVIEEPISFLSKIIGTITRGYVLAPLVILLFITGTTIASADALPGDTLYGVKLQVESARLLIAPTESAKLELQTNFAQKRLEEDEKVNAFSDAQVKLQVGKDSDRSNRREDKTSDEKKSVEDNRNQRQTKSREQADKALEFLNKAKNDWQQKGDENKAHEIDDKVKKFREDLEKRLDSEQNRVREQFRNDRNNSGSYRR